MKRIQRKRTKGWKMPPNTVYVGRPTKWGNKYRVGFLTAGVNGPVFITPEIAVEKYRFLLKKELHFGRLSLEELRGKDLACFCPLDQPCHADVIIEFCKITEK